MTKKSNKPATTQAPALFVFGLDWDGKPRGAKFREIRDDIASAAIDMKFNVIVRPTGEFANLATKLPTGRLFGKDKLIVPIIRKDLYDKIVKAHQAIETADASETRNSTTMKSAVPSAAKAKPVSGLPTNWDDIGPGDLVLIQEAPDEGWWEAIVVKREGDVLTLRYRDFSGSPTCIRHISAIARVYPGPF